MKSEKKREELRDKDKDKPFDFNQRIKFVVQIQSVHKNRFDACLSFLFSKNFFEVSKTFFEVSKLFSKFLNLFLCLYLDFFGILENI